MTAPPLTHAARSRLSGIEGLRGMAALGVVAWHQLGFTVTQPLLGHAYKGVGLFFMISGFVIAARYEDELKAGLNPWRFGFLRLMRLYPLYLAGALLGFALACMGLGLPGLGPSEALRALPAALAFLPGGLSQVEQIFPLNAPAWSLYLELAACLAYAFLLPALTTRTLAIAVIAGFVLIETQLLRWGNLDGGWSRTSFLVGIARILYAFPAGVLLHRWWRAGRLPRVQLPIWSVCVAFVLVIAIPPGHQHERLLELLITGLLWPVLIILAADAQGAPWEARTAEALGAPSYALYALHFPVLLAFHRLYPTPGTSGAIWAGVASLALCCGMALAATRWIDAPARRLLSASPRLRPYPA